MTLPSPAEYRLTNCCVAMFQRNTLPSLDPETANWSSGENAARHTSPLWPANGLLIAVPVATSQRMSFPSKDVDSAVLPPELKTTQLIGARFLFQVPWP